VAQHRLVVDGFFGGGPDDRGLARSRRLRQRFGSSVAVFRGSGAACGLAGVPTIFVPA
jgi:hypothetical protein